MCGANLHADYARATLDEHEVERDPIGQFARWFAQALAAGIPDPHAMSVATATRAGRPAARVVLLRGFDERGFVFYTNYESRKGRDLAENPYAALVFYWAELERQVRITGSVNRVSPEESERYFHGRPVASQLGAWASRQSHALATRAELEARLAELAEQYRNREIPLPPFWGGYRVTPDTIEFWQGRPSRLHDRLQYTRHANGDWLIERLSP